MCIKRGCTTCVEADVDCGVANETEEGKADGYVKQLLAQLLGVNACHKRRLQLCAHESL